MKKNFIAVGVAPFFSLAILFLGLAHEAMAKENPTEWQASYYDGNSGPQFMWGMQLLKIYSLIPDASILSVGCGIGDIEAALLERNPTIKNIVATDKSASMIKRAAEKYSRHPKLSFETIDALHLAAAYDSCFDHVVCLNAFLWFSDQNNALRQMSAVLKPGGTILVNSTMKSENFSWPLLESFDRVAKSQKWKDRNFDSVSAMHADCPGLDTDTLQEDLRHADLLLVHLETEIIIRTLFPSKALFAEFLQPILRGYSTLNILSEDEKNDFISDVADEFIRRYSPHTNNGEVEYALPHNAIVIAQKAR